MVKMTQQMCTSASPGSLQKKYKNVVDVSLPEFIRLKRKLHLYEEFDV